MVNNLSNSNPLPDWYQTNIDKVFKEPENNLKVLNTALEAIKQGMINDKEIDIEKKGLTKQTYEALKHLATKIPSASNLEKESIQNDIRNKTNELSKKTVDLKDLPPDSVYELLGFLPKLKEVTEKALVAKNFHKAVPIATRAEKNIHTLFKEMEKDNNPNMATKILQFLGLIDSKKPLPPLELPKDYSLTEKTYENFINMMPTDKEGQNKNYKNTLNSLILHASEIKPNSDLERLTIFLMNNVDGWDIDKASEQDWPEGSKIKSLIKDIKDVCAADLSSRKLQK